MRQISFIFKGSIDYSLLPLFLSIGFIIYVFFKKNTNEICKSRWFILIMRIFIIRVIALGVIPASILSVSVYGYLYGLLKFMLLI